MPGTDGQPGAAAGSSDFWPESYKQLAVGHAVSVTPRELRCLELCALGRSDVAIARDCGITRHTVRFHMRSLVHKLAATNRCHAVAIAIRRGLI